MFHIVGGNDQLVTGMLNKLPPGTVQVLDLAPAALLDDELHRKVPSPLSVHLLGNWLAVGPAVSIEEQLASTDNGKPVVRRGRKARSLFGSGEIARLPVQIEQGRSNARHNPPGVPTTRRRTVI